VDALRAIDGWPAANAAAAVVRAGVEPATHGDRSRGFCWASITKLFTAYACLVAAEEGTIDLDEPAGPPGSTVRHLLAHASGLPFHDGMSMGRVEARRVYSNPGIELAATTLAQHAGIPFDAYLGEAVLDPLRLGAELRGSPAAGMRGSLDDLTAFAQELLAPRLIAPETLAEATSVQFPGLAGVLPDVGRFEPLDWGLGFELKDGKSPHWSGMRTSARTFGHFGGSGTFLWVDPELALALVCLTDLEFGPWAMEAWPALSDAVIAELLA
jgi:CubicO group peptidase (beta-lactamase class C family)